MEKRGDDVTEEGRKGENYCGRCLSEIDKEATVVTESDKRENAAGCATLRILGCT